MARPGAEVGPLPWEWLQIATAALPRPHPPPQERPSCSGFLPYTHLELGHSAREGPLTPGLGTGLIPRAQLETVPVRSSGWQASGRPPLNTELCLDQVPASAGVYRTFERMQLTLACAPQQHQTQILGLPSTKQAKFKF